MFSLTDCRFGCIGLWRKGPTAPEPALLMRRSICTPSSAPSSRVVPSSEVRSAATVWIHTSCSARSSSARLSSAAEAARGEGGETLRFGSVQHEIGHRGRGAGREGDSEHPVTGRDVGV